MSGSNYLQGITDGYGLPATLPPGLAAQASEIVDAYLKRPEGLVYVSDANGNPSYMAAMAPSQSFTISGAMTPGTNVVATVSPAIVRPDLIGEVLVIDRGTTGIQEACIVTATSGNNQITFGTVQFSHSPGAKADLGVVITEDRNCPSKRSIVRIAKYPIVNIISLMGRYAYGRRSDQVGGLYQEMNLLASVQTFGGPPQWVPISTQQASWSSSTGEVWVPAGMLMAYYSDVRVKYVAGFPTVPDSISRATAMIASAILNSPGPANTKMYAAGGTKIQQFAATMIDDDARELLNPYMARTMY